MQSGSVENRVEIGDYRFQVGLQIGRKTKNFSRKARKGLRGDRKEGAEASATLLASNPVELDSNAST